MFTQIKQFALASSMVLLTGWDASAQQQLAQQHTNRYSLLQPFVSEGVLVDRSPISLLRSTQGLDPDKFSYQRQDTSTFSDFVSYYRLWQGASYQNNSFPHNADALTELARLHEFGGSLSPNWQQRIVQHEVVLAGMRFNYREIAEDALDSMYVFYDGTVDKFKLGLGSITYQDTVFTNPNDLSQYSIQSITRSFNNAETLQRWSVIRSFFMLAAHTQAAIVDVGQPVRFSLPNDLFFGNLTGLQLQLDLDDGLGFRSIQPGQSVQTHYPAQGLKHIRYRLLNADNGQVTQQMGIIALRVGSMRLGQPTHLIQSNFSPCIQFPGVSPGIGTAFVRTAPQNQGRIRKPFVLVEGIETADYVLNAPTLVNASVKGFGKLNWYSISSGEYGPGNEHMAELTNFLDSINRAGYDIVFVDFITNRDRIEANAMALASILQQINQQLTNNGSDANIELVGASMGGLISRVALRQMELAGCCHNVKLFTTYASPHLGANIPLAIQHSLKDLGTRSNAFGMLNEQKERYDHILNSPAARQMLIYHVEPSAQQDRDRFLQLLQDQGLPREPRKSAVTNGSIAGLIQKVSDDVNAPFIQPGMQLLAASAEVWVPNNFPLPHSAKSYRAVGTNGMYYLKSEGYVLPHSPTVASNALIYKAGQGAWANFEDIAGAYLTYATGLFKLGKITFTTITAASANPPLAPGILAAGAIRATLHSVGVDRSLQDQLNTNITDNQNKLIITANFPSLGVDYAPGDYQETAQEFKKNILYTQRQFISRFTFVNTLSSLEQIQPNLFTNVDLNSFKSQSNSFRVFENLYYSSDGGNQNTVHVNVDLILSNQIQVNQLATTSSLKIQPFLQGNLNIARPLFVGQTPWLMNADVEVAPWTVQSGGVLGINRNAAVNVSYLQNLPPSLPAPNFHLVTKTSTFDCDSVPVVILGGGRMELGEILPGNQLSAEVYFRNASTLTLMPGSLLRINNRSRLIIEPGATLVIHPGAQIELVGDSAILEIRGRVFMQPNAVFGFSGSGFVRMNQSAWNPQVGWQFGGNNSIQFLGSGRNDKVLEIQGEWLVPSTQVAFRITQGQVWLHTQSRLNLYGHVNIQQTLFTGSPTTRHRGLVVHGQNSVIVRNSEFRHGENGITSFTLTYGNPLVLDGVGFFNNNIGIETHGKSVNLVSCRGSNNHTFWRGYDIEGLSRVNSCWVTQNTHGLDVMGQNGARLDITNSTIDSNLRAVFSFGDLKLRAFCSSFSNNQEGIYAGNTQVLLGGRANNKFRNNNIAIYLEEVDNLYLYDGFNDFFGSNWYVTGRFTGIAHNHLQQLPLVTGYFLNVRNNRMPLQSQLIPIDLEDGDGNPVLAHQWTFLSSLPANCIRQASADYDYYVLSTSSISRPVVVDGSTFTLPQALLNALELVSRDEMVISPTDMQAIGQFHQVLAFMRQLPLSSISAEEHKLLDIALSRMIEAVSNAYRFNLVAAARADEEFPLSNAIWWTIQEIEHRIVNIGDQSSDSALALSLQLAHVLRIGEYYDKAIGYLNDIVNISSYLSDYHQQAVYWLCVCEAERDLIKEVISSKDFELRRQPCLAMMPSMRIPSKWWQSHAPYRLENELSLQIKAYPNPVRDVLTLEHMSDRGKSRVLLFDMKGQQLGEWNWVNPNEALRLPVEMLPTGLYAIQIQSEDGGKAVIKFSKQ